MPARLPRVDGERQAVIAKAVDLSPIVAMAAVLFGAAMAGVAGAVLATPLVGAAKLVYSELIAAEPAAVGR